MFKISKGEIVLGMVDEPTYIRLHENGCFVLCDKKDATGIAYQGVPYHIIGAPELTPEAESVFLQFVETASEISRVDYTTSITFVAMAESGGIDDVTACEHMDNFAAWAYPVAYSVGNMRRHNGKLYRCVQAHTSQADWTPDTAASLWTLCSDPAEEWPAWSAPVGAHDAYNTGDKVSHNDKKWVSTADSNVWEPGVYGWVEFAEA